MHMPDDSDHYTEACRIPLPPGIKDDDIVIRWLTNYAWALPHEIAREVAAVHGLAAPRYALWMSTTSERIGRILAEHGERMMWWWTLRARRFTETLTVLAGWIVECRAAFDRIDTLRVMHHDGLGVVTREAIDDLPRLPLSPDEDGYPWQVGWSLEEALDMSERGESAADRPPSDGPASMFVPPDELDPVQGLAGVVMRRAIQRMIESVE